MKKLLALSLSLCLILCMLSFPAFGEGGDIEINLYGIGDFGGALDDAGTPTGNPGGARIVGKIKELTAQASNPIVVAGGTSYTGSAISETNHGELVNAMYKAMGVQYAAVGNHDFDWSDVNTRDEVFGAWQEQGGFTFLSANVFWTEGEKAGELVFTPYEITEIDGIKVGFFSVIDEGNMSAISNVNKEGIEMRSALEAAKASVKALREEGAQVVIALAHLYGAQDAPYTVQEPITSSLADLIEACREDGGIDAVFGSQTTIPLCGKVGDTAVVKAQNFGRFIGHLTITVSTDGTVKSEPELIPLTQIVVGEETLFDSSEATRESLPVDEGFLALYNSYNDALTILMDAPRGTSDVDMSFEGDDLKFAYQKWYLRNNLYYLNNVYGEHVDAYFHQRGGIRNIGSDVVKAGDPINLRLLYASAPFENYIYTLDMKGSDIRALLSGECQYGTYTSLLQYGFDVVYESGDPYEANGPIASLTIGGEPIDDEATYRIATNSFLYPGPGDGIDFAAGFNASHTNVLNRTALLKSILHQSANLTALSAADLEPAFAPTVYAYTASSIEEIEAVAQGDATVTVEKAEDGSSATITVVSPYEDPYTEPGTVANTYTVTLK
ncbi:MAG: 5'-nucleotidase C-terminal domain-containing protein [Clostridia bacterium]|nr:5'-nucleotidase C-terminal domain-containing protein [Clostridia bacterium]